jgi:capsular polysaccharide biosynthesis protein
LLRSRSHRAFSAGTSAAATAFNLQTNYFHFLLEDVPRLILLKHEVGLARIYSGRYPRPLPNFVREVLDLLEIELVQVSRPLAFKNLWFTRKLGSDFGPSQLAVSLLRKSFAPLDAEADSLVYVSRKNSQRSLIDEGSLEKSLQKLGFHSVFFEQMEF